MAVRLINGKWYVDFRYRFQRYRKKSPLNTKGGAKAYEVQLMDRLLRGETLDPPATAEHPPTFEVFAWQWFETYVKANNKPTEQRNKETMLRAHLVPWFGAMPLAEISGRSIEAFKSSLLAIGLKPKTVNLNLTVLRRCLRSAEEWGMLDRIPTFRCLRAPPPPFDFLTEEEATQLLADAREPPWNRMVLMALHTGMRIGELLGLQWEDVDFEQRLITIRYTLFDGILSTPKSHKARYVPMSRQVQASLLPARRVGGPVIARSDPGNVNHRTAARALERICRRTGVRRITWHVLRHTFASHLVARGVPLYHVQKLLGHSTSAMTERYAHLAPSNLRDAIDVLERCEVSKFGQWVGNRERGASLSTPSSPLEFDHISAQPSKNHLG